jgi:hypothetical protein
MELPAPILVISDDPSQSSGLARITRDLCTLLASMPEFRVASLGWMGTGSARLPWAQYRMQAAEFGEYALPAVWDEHSRGKIGIVLTTWDATRITWLARPEFCEHAPTREWLQARRHKSFQLWSYLPFDAIGPRGRFTAIVKDTLLGIDRIVVPTPAALRWVIDTLGEEEAWKRGASWIPHPFDGKRFNP